LDALVVPKFVQLHAFTVNLKNSMSSIRKDALNVVLVMKFVLLVPLLESKRKR
jgi:hypothetical protein